MKTIVGFVTTPGATYDMSDTTITSPVTLTSGVVWKGGLFSSNSPAFISKGFCIGASILNVELAGDCPYLLEGNQKPFVTYDGSSDNTFLYKNLTVDGVKLGPKSTLFNGTYEGPKTFHDVVFGLTIKNVVKTYDPTISVNTLVTGHSIYKFRAENWKLIGDTRTGLVDNGVVQINSGNGQVKNIYRRGKQYGYIMRCWGVAIGSDPDQDVKVENCVDAETVCYGTLDFRIDPGQLQYAGTTPSIPLKGCSVFFLNNTSANKIDMNNGYVTAAVVLGQTVDDIGVIWPITIQNNVAFGAQLNGMSGGSSLLKDNSSGKSKIYKQNNSDTPPGQPAPAGVVDSDYFGLGTIGAQRPTVPPPVVKQRSVKYSTWDGLNNTWTYYFDDGSIQETIIQ